MPEHEVTGIYTHIHTCIRSPTLRHANVVWRNWGTPSLRASQFSTVAAALLQRFVSAFFLRSEILNALHENAIHELLLGTFGRRHV